MIGFVRGTIIGGYISGRKNQFLVIWPEKDIEGPGVGYSILVSLQVAALYPINSIAQFWVYSVHTEKESYYIGLDAAEKQSLFVKLLDVSGVGPKTALQIVDTLGASELKQVIAAQDQKSLSKIPGVGAKTAAKIVLELSGSFDMEALNESKQKSPTQNTVLNHVKAALMNLGYTEKEARQLISSAQEEIVQKTKETTDIAELLKIVFKYVQVR